MCFPSPYVTHTLVKCIKWTRWYRSSEPDIFCILELYVYVGVAWSLLCQMVHRLPSCVTKDRSFSFWDEGIFRYSSVACAGHPVPRLLEDELFPFYFLPMRITSSSICEEYHLQHFPAGGGDVTPRKSFHVELSVLFSICVKNVSIKCGLGFYLSCRIFFLFLSSFSS